MKRLLLAFAALVGTALPSAAQDDVSAFYKGKTIRLIVGVGVGSGYDINARLLARHLGAHIPGQPAVIVLQKVAGSALYWPSFQAASRAMEASAARLARVGFPPPRVPGNPTLIT